MDCNITHSITRLIHTSCHRAAHACAVRLPVPAHAAAASRPRRPAAFSHRHLVPLAVTKPPVVQSEACAQLQRAPQPRTLSTRTSSLATSCTGWRRPSWSADASTVKQRSDGTARRRSTPHAHRRARREGESVAQGRIRGESSRGVEDERQSRPVARQRANALGVTLPRPPRDADPY
ncbi:hypothetical protein FKP32DRAFT_6108 [Trametes sanguinea]|nr:hypothetical protein FKP32DRAFT_6108 [Trametes sanguinea]